MKCRTEITTKQFVKLSVVVPQTCKEQMDT